MDYFVARHHWPRNLVMDILGLNQGKTPTRISTPITREVAIAYDRRIGEAVNLPVRPTVDSLPGEKADFRLPYQSHAVDFVRPDLVSTCSIQTPCFEVPQPVVETKSNETFYIVP